MEMRLNEAIPILERSPSTLRALLASLPEPWIRGNEGGDSWSPYDVVGHLIHGEKTDWIPRARRILELGESKPFDPFDRRGLHPSLGPVTLRQLLATWVAHDLGHLAQIARVLAKQYASEVGPWKEYLPILHDRDRSVARG